MSTAYINLGSNTGDRRSVIDRAVAAIERRLGCTARRSHEVVSAPWGFESPNMFLNLGIAVETTLDPLTLLRLLQQTEREIDPSPHRDTAGNYIDRHIDIDLIAVGDTVIDSPELTLPHPRMHLRDFVLRPMAELAPEWIHPLLGRLW